VARGEWWSRQGRDRQAGERAERWERAGEERGWWVNIKSNITILCTYLSRYNFKWLKRKRIDCARTGSGELGSQEPGKVPKRDFLLEPECASLRRQPRILAYPAGPLRPSPPSDHPRIHARPCRGSEAARPPPSRLRPKQPTLMAHQRAPEVDFALADIWCYSARARTSSNK